VQGVGFRYTAQSLAAQFPIAGFVRNLSNGDVELVAEGSAEQVNGFLEAVAACMADYVSSVEVQEIAASDLQGFRIRF